MPFTQVNYKRLYYKDWAPENGAEAKATIVMVGNRFKYRSSLYFVLENTAALDYPALQSPFLLCTILQATYKSTLPAD